AADAGLGDDVGHMLLLLGRTRVCYVARTGASTADWIASSVIQAAASGAGPRRTGNFSTRNTRTRPWSAKVSTDPTFTGVAARSAILPSIRMRLVSTRAWAAVRVLAILANHRNLSSRNAGSAMMLPQMRKRAEGIARCGGTGLPPALAIAAAPAPAILLFAETKIVEQPPEAFRVQTE